MSSTAQTHILAIDDDPAMRKLWPIICARRPAVTAVATGAEMAQALASTPSTSSCSTCASRGGRHAAARRLREESKVPSSLSPQAG